MNTLLNTLNEKNILTQITQEIEQFLQNNNGEYCSHQILKKLSPKTQIQLEQIIKNREGNRPATAGAYIKAVATQICKENPKYKINPQGNCKILKKTNTFSRV